jgi:hypothetical protein
MDPFHESDVEETDGDFHSPQSSEVEKAVRHKKLLLEWSDMAHSAGRTYVLQRTFPIKATFEASSPTDAMASYLRNWQPSKAICATCESWMVRRSLHQ